MPESSASAGSRARRLAWRALASAFSTKVACGSSASSMPSSDCTMTSMPIGPSIRRNSRSFPSLDDARTRRESAGMGPLFVRSSLERSPLRRGELANTALGERDEPVHLGASEWRALRRTLDLDDATAACHDDVHVRVASGILGVVEVEGGLAAEDPDRHRRDGIGERFAGHHALRPAPVDRVAKGYPGAGDRSAARAAVGLDHVAVDAKRALAERTQIGDGAQAPADEPLDLVGAPRLPALGGFPPHARVGRAGQHAVFGSDPALPPALEEGRNVGFDARRAENAGLAALDQYRAFGVARVTPNDADRPQFIGAPAAGAPAR